MRSISIGTVSLLLVPPVVSSEDWSKLLHFWCALSHLRTSSGSSGYLQFSLRFKLKWVFRAPVMQRSMIAHFNSSPKTVPALRVSSKRKTCAWSDFDTWKAGQAVTEDSKASPLAWVLGLIDSVSCLRAWNPLPAGAARAMLNALFSQVQQEVHRVLQNVVELLQVRSPCSVLLQVLLWFVPIPSETLHPRKADID